MSEIRCRPSAFMARRACASGRLVLIANLANMGMTPSEPGPHGDRLANRPASEQHAERATREADPTPREPGPEFVEQDGVGIADALQRLWTPHRMAYIKGQDKPDHDEPHGCPFCQIPKLDDVEALIVARGREVYAVLNLYPYNPGHLMVVPYRHVADYTELTLTETVEVAEFTQRAMRAVRAVSGAHGFNIGLNQGVIAGAGIAAHLHQHLVPRWGGDSNFMPVIGHTKVLPQLLGDTRELLADAWATA